MLYFLIIFITMFICISLAVVSSFFGVMPLWYAFTMPFLVVAYDLIFLGIVCVVMRLLPKALWDYRRKRFTVGDEEVKFYDQKLHIKSWKEKVPEAGAASGFPKDKIYSTEEKYLKRFLEENCFAESMHFVAGLIGITALFFLPTADFFFAIPITIVNFVLNIMPSMIQRYNRPKLVRIYEKICERNKSHECFGESESMEKAK